MQQNVLGNSSAINQDGSESSSDVEATEESSSKSSAHQEEYMFPTPEEIKNACAPTVGMVFATCKRQTGLWMFMVSCVGLLL